MKRIGIALILTGLLAILSACATFGAATPAKNGEIQVILKDYDFTPDVIRVQAGQKVTIVLSNEGRKLHEFMVGRNVIVENNFTEGFAEDFFAGITPEIHGPGMVMGLAGGDMEHDMDSMAGSETMADMEHNMDKMAESETMAGDMAKGEQMAGMEHNMDEMAGGATMADMEHNMDEMAESETMADMEHNMDKMAESETMAGDMAGMEHDMDSSMEGTFGLLAHPSMDAHAGLMVMIDPATIPSDQVTTITFTVPEDKVGEWEMGCFQERGQHYDDGMRGKLIVEPSS